MEALFAFVAKILVVLFAVGVAGCLIVIPVTATELFRTSLTPDTAAEMAGEARTVTRQP
jgi:hypothetical protein